MKKTRFCFDLPVTKDWLFYVFLFSLASIVLGSIRDGAADNEITLGLADVVFRIFTSWFPLIPIIYWIRKFIRKKKLKSDDSQL